MSKREAKSRFAAADETSDSDGDAPPTAFYTTGAPLRRFSKAVVPPQSPPGLTAAQGELHLGSSKRT